VLQALCLHQEHHLTHTLDLICRMPAMRHAPLKELTRLAAHLKEATFSKGVLLDSWDALLGAGRVDSFGICMLVCCWGHSSCRQSAMATPQHAAAAEGVDWSPKQLHIPFAPTNGTRPAMCCYIRAVCSAGQTILSQGQEVTDIHFVLQGTVHLTYSAVATKAAARAAARASVNGALPAAPAAAAAAAGNAPRITSGGRFSGLAQALRLEQICFDAPVVLATRWVTAYHAAYPARMQQQAV
jgi:hypothetical protein